MKTIASLLAVAALLGLTNLTEAAISVQRSGATVTGITLTRGAEDCTYTVADGGLINVQLTSFAAYNASSLLIPYGSTYPASGSRHTLLEDWRLDSGVINPAVSATAMGVTFNAPVFNVAGADILLFEYAGDRGITPDPVQFKINGVTKSYAGSLASLVLSNSPKEFTCNTVKTRSGSTDITVTSLAALESASLALSSTGEVTQGVTVLAIDLSDYGVALGQSVSSMTFGSTGSTVTIDPVLIVGLVPEPATLGLLAAGGLALLRRKR